MTTPEITVATPADRDGIVATLIAAFPADPVVAGYMFPDPDTYPRYAAAFFGHLFDKRVHHGTVWTVAGGASVSIWEPPATGAERSDDDLAAVLPPEALDRVRAYGRALHTVLPAEPSWYLGVLGTHPDHAGRRLGRAVMRAGLNRAAAEGAPAVLETSNPGNVELYRRAGWEVVDSFTEPVPTWVMRQ